MMGLLQSDKVVFYHPCDDSTEFTKAEDWEESTPTYVTGKISNGLAPTVSDPAYGSEYEFLSASATYVSTTKLDASRFVVAYQDQGDSKGQAKVGTVSGSDVTFGSAHEFCANAEEISVAAFSSTKLVVAYKDANDSNHGTARIGTVSGTDITFGTEAEFSTGQSRYHSVAILGSDHFVVVYRHDADSGHGTASAGHVTGTSISFGAQAEFLSASAARYTAAVALDSSRFVVAYQEGSNDYGWARVGTVSGTEITFGAVSQFLGSGVTYIAATALGASTFVVFYQDESDAYSGASNVGTVSGTDITFGARVEFMNNPGPLGGAYVMSADRLSATAFVVVWRDNTDSNDGKARVGTVSGTDVTYGAETEFSSGMAETPSVSALSSSKFVVAFRDEADSNHGTSIVGDIAAAAALENQSGTDFGAEAEFLSQTTYMYRDPIAILDASTFVVVCRDGAASDAGKARVGSVSGTDITFGAAIEFRTTTVVYCGVAALSATKVVVVYTDWNDSKHGTAKVGTVSGTDITFGPEKEYLSADGAAYNSVAALSSTAFVVAYNDDSDSGHGTAKVGTVSGGDITFGAEAEFNGAGITYDISAAALSATKIVIAYRDVADSHHGTAKVGTIAGTAITFGAEAEFLSAGGAYNISAAELSATAFVVAYKDGADSNHGTAKVGTVAGTDITFGAEAEFLSADGIDGASVAALSSTAFVVAYKDGADSGHGTAKIGTVSGTGITFGAEVEFASAGAAGYPSVAAFSASEFVAAYVDGADSSHGTAKVGTANLADPYPTVASETRIAFCGWFQKPSA